MKNFNDLLFLGFVSFLKIICRGHTVLIIAGQMTNTSVHTLVLHFAAGRADIINLETMRSYSYE